MVTNTRACGPGIRWKWWPLLLEPLASAFCAVSALSRGIAFSPTCKSTFVRRLCLWLWPVFYKSSESACLCFRYDHLSFLLSSVVCFSLFRCLPLSWFALWYYHSFKLGVRCGVKVLACCWSVSSRAEACLLDRIASPTQGTKTQNAVEKRKIDNKWAPRSITWASSRRGIHQEWLAVWE